VSKSRRTCSRIRQRSSRQHWPRREPQGSARGKRGAGGSPPTGPDALAGNLFAAAVTHFRAGRLDEAERACRDVLTFDRNHAHALHFLGLVAFQCGRHDTALELIARAFALDRRNADCAFNMAQVLRALGRIEEAAAHFAQATELRRDYAAAHLALADLYLQQGRFAEAVPRYRRSLALQSAPAEAYSNFGVALAGLGQWDEAATQYRRALALKPELIDVYRNLGRIVLAQGDAAEALALTRRALAKRETVELRALFVQCVRELAPSAIDGELRALIARALTEGWSRPSELSALAGELCGHDDDLAALAEDQLLLALIQSAPVRTLALESVLTGARRQLLARATTPGADENSLLDFACALAQQCFINEYVLATSEEEAAQARELQNTLAAALATGAEIPPLLLAAMAAYAPLSALALADALLQRSWPPAIEALITQQVREPLTEREIRDSIPALTTITDDISRKVQRQYEDMPYPRWIKPAPVGQPVTIDWYLRSQFPSAPIRASLPQGGIDILIAGCGTGQHAIETAQRFAQARVLAIDLSRTSLGYAIRQARALGLANVDYAQADILQLGTLGRSFDLIEVGGVLHHMRDWAEGWRALLTLLRPGGFMHVGLYSALARSDIRAARAFIAEHGYGESADDIRRCRQDILRLEESSALHNVTKYADFFTTNECRDLLFHVQEQQLSIPEITAFLRAHGLAFLGFTGPASAAYRARFPADVAMTDLDQWHQFETENPTAFIGMYQFWVQKA
jgi:tetratricopeptide (TPR) repeat protein/SAM-dependent methyltransferase